MQGLGTPESPFIITTVLELQSMNDNLSASYILGNDIDASDTVNWNSNAGFIPIGDSTTTFTGSLDGNGKTISNLYINRPGVSFTGMFGLLGPQSEVSSMTLDNFNVSGGQHSGILSGVMDQGMATEIKCINFTLTANGTGSGPISGYVSNVILIKDCEVRTGQLSSTTTHAGGFVGYCRNTHIQNCLSEDVTVSSPTGRFIGGFVGIVDRDNPLIENCYANNNVTANDYSGGFVAQQVAGGGIIRNCYSKGTFTGGGGGYNGGFIGVLYSTRNYNPPVITNCYAAVVCNFSGSNNGGFAGAITQEGGTSPPQITSCYWDTTLSGISVSVVGTGKTTTEMYQQATYTEWDFVDTWQIDEGVFYPELQVLATVVSILAPILLTPTQVSGVVKLTWEYPVS